MASMYGINLKSLKKFIGTEGEAYQGNLYLGNKKIGFWSQDGNGGADWVQLDKAYSTSKLENVVEDSTSSSLEYLMMELLAQIEIEKKYKQNLKKGYETIIALIGEAHICTISIINKTERTDDEMLEMYKDNINKAKEVFYEFENIRCRIYRSLDDFNIGDPIDINKIKV